MRLIFDSVAYKRMNLGISGER